LLLFIQQVIPERCDFFVFQGGFPHGKVILELVTAKTSCKLPDFSVFVIFRHRFPLSPNAIFINL